MRLANNVFLATFSSLKSPLIRATKWRRVTVQSLVREAQAAMLHAFDRADTVTAAQLHAATAAFSEKTANRGRAGLTRQGVLIRSRRGMEGEVTYTIDQRQLASLVRSQSLSKSKQQRQRMANNAAAAFPTEECDAASADVNDAIKYESTRTVSRAWGWLVSIIICVCGLGAIGLVRRRFGAPIEKTEPFPGALDFAPESDA